MTQRRNFDPSEDDRTYEQRHIKIRVSIDVDLHNVGDEFSIEDAVSWLDDALSKGLSIADPNDHAEIVEGSASLVARPDCKCYADYADSEV